jgi:hypothetical protein
MKSGWSLLCDVLTAPLSPAELHEVDQHSTNLAERLQILEDAQVPLNVAALQMARHRASNTLKKVSDEIVHWEKTLAKFSEQLANGRPLDLDMIAEWNALLRNEATAPYRDLDLYLVEKKLIDFNEVPSAMKDFEKKVLKADEDPVLNASRIYQWLITIHPFANGNGRTARLATDYVLMQNGYLPVVFPSARQSFVAISPEQPYAVTPMDSFRSVVHAVERSLDILQLGN